MFCEQLGGSLARPAGDRTDSSEKGNGLLSLYSTAAAAAQCNVHPETLRRLYTQGKVPAYKFGLNVSLPT
jgi:hypothetical protein